VGSVGNQAIYKAVVGPDECDRNTHPLAPVNGIQRDVARMGKYYNSLDRSPTPTDSKFFEIRRPK
jgi:hypothetical protein